MRHVALGVVELPWLLPGGGQTLCELCGGWLVQQDQPASDLPSQTSEVGEFSLEELHLVQSQPTPHLPKSPGLRHCPWVWCGLGAARVNPLKALWRDLNTKSHEADCWVFLGEVWRSN